MILFIFKKDTDIKGRHIIYVDIIYLDVIYIISKLGNFDHENMDGLGYGERSIGRLAL